MKLQVGGLYSYPAAARKVEPYRKYYYYDNRYILVASDEFIDHIERGESFVLLEVDNNPEVKSCAHLKVLTAKGIVGWITYIDKTELVKITQP